MSQKAIREFDGKRLLLEHFEKTFQGPITDLPTVGARSIQIGPDTDLDSIPLKYPWVKSTKLVCKPDQLIKRRGKSNLLLLNADFDAVCTWVSERRGVETTVSGVSGKLTHFLVEPFLPHESSEEMYVCVSSVRDGDEVLFYHAGGVDIGDVDSKASRLLVPVGADDAGELRGDFFAPLLGAVADAALRARLQEFLLGLYRFTQRLHFAYFEVNPLVVTAGAIVPLDIAAKVDQTAEFLCERLWGPGLDFPPPFGREPYPEERYIADLDSRTGSSLKLTVLNPAGRVWMMVAGGGASVVYADAVADLGWGDEMANYGEYSGDPTDTLTFEYASTILGLMTSSRATAAASARELPKGAGKVLIIGGGIANFTNVAATFKGIIAAIKKHAVAMKENKVHIYVRRGGPNYQEGLLKIKEAVSLLGIPIEVYGPETHITSIVSLALGKETADVCVEYGSSSSSSTTSNFFQSQSQSSSFTNLTELEKQETESKEKEKEIEEKEKELKEQEKELKDYHLFNEFSTCLVYGLQTKAVQRMLDFDYISKRKPSVSAMVYPFAGDHYQKFHWGAQEILLPVLGRLEDAAGKFPDARVLINFASLRSVFKSVRAALAIPQFRTIAVIAEGVPEQHTKRLIAECAAKGVSLLGPATVGGLRAGAFRVGNAGGAMDNILASRLYRAGSVAYVSKSGGLSNELNNIVSRHADGVVEGVAIGGDRFPGTTFLDHLLRFERDPAVKLMVLLGEVGGAEEYRVCEAVRAGRLTKPLVAWCVGTCARLFPYEVQFGHAGACASGEGEGADAKNAALRACGARVPPTFEQFGREIEATFAALVRAGAAQDRRAREPPVPSLPMDFDWAQKLGLIRKPASFISTITDERGEELLYAGMPISRVFEERLGIGGVVSLLWFKRRLPPYACEFIEMVLMVTADHGPAVSGAHNTIVATRAGKDLVSSLCSGLLVIGERWGGSLDSASKVFTNAVDSGMTPRELIEDMASKRQYLPGIGHKVKSLENPDRRVQIIKEYARKNFPSTTVLDYACKVEVLCCAKRSTLILNVDGAIACAFVDMMRSCGAFTRAEADEYVQSGVMNALFVVGRSIGFVGHHLDQKRLRQGLYRHDTGDVAYILDDFQ